ncbi:hypothetical protein ILUMI_03713 [Ignelater luminosus]|uniref:Uncharacterized protein n=1 Tax=Ignelater luminosus TaxID=2038154 RepID=A0A8K0GLW8_IGNLU|nr:hypothetical protein ILUMI_03713 [Ignelater luminosus]
MESTAKQQLISEQNALRNWELAIFSHEKTFCSSEDYTKTPWRSVNTRYEIQHIQPKKRSGRISLGYWGWMSQAGPGELVQVNSHFSIHDYVEVLEDVILPSVSAFYPEGQIVFVQDNSPIYRAISKVIAINGVQRRNVSLYIKSAIALKINRVGTLVIKGILVKELAEWHSNLELDLGYSIYQPLKAFLAFVLEIETKEYAHQKGRHAFDRTSKEI